MGARKGQGFKRLITNGARIRNLRGGQGFRLFVARAWTNRKSKYNYCQETRAPPTQITHHPPRTHGMNKSHPRSKGQGPAHASYTTTRRAPMGMNKNPTRAHAGCYATTRPTTRGDEKNLIPAGGVRAPPAAGYTTTTAQGLTNHNKSHPRSECQGPAGAGHTTRHASTGGKNLMPAREPHPRRLHQHPLGTPRG